MISTNAPLATMASRVVRLMNCWTCERLYAATTKANAARLAAARADGSARPGQRGLVCCREARQPGQAGQAHARTATAAEVVVGAAIAIIDPRLHIFRQLHCFTLGRSASHGLLTSDGLVSSKWGMVPSGVVTLVTVRPVFSARLTELSVLKLFFSWRGAANPSE